MFHFAFILGSLSQCGCVNVAKPLAAAPVASPLRVPAIIVQPVSQAVTVGQTAAFAVSVSSKAAVTYQWKQNSLPVNGAVAASYAMSDAVMADNGTQFSVVISNAAGSVTSKPATLTVEPYVAPLQIVTFSLAADQIGVPYTTTLAAIGGTPPYTWAITSGSLPAGLTLNAASGAISGTPSVWGTARVTLHVRDSSTPILRMATKPLSLTVKPMPLSIATTSLPNGQVGAPYGVTLVSVGGVPPYNWSIASGAIPSGLVLNAATGSLSGAPTVSGHLTFDAMVTDATTPTPQTSHAGLTISIFSETGRAVSLSWVPSSSAGATGYNIYRSNTSGSGYSKINTTAVSGLTYLDATVIGGQNYFYVFTTVDQNGNESDFSAELQQDIP